MDFQEFLNSRDACEEAKAWVRDKTTEQAWTQCPHTDWMFWLVHEIVREQELKQEIVRAVADIARTVLVHTTDHRTHDCMATVDRWLAGEQVDLRAAKVTALGAAFWAAQATEAAWAAAWAVHAAASAAQATDALTAADYAAAAAARIAKCALSGSQHAGIVRKHLPWATIQPLLERAMKDST